MSNFHRLKNEGLRDIAIIGVAAGIGAPDPGCGDAPGVFQALGIAQELTSAHRIAAWKTTITPLEGSDKTTIIANCASRTARVVYATLMAGDFPIVLGGDHSCAIGSWRGVAESLPGKPLGLIWIDAHLDSHTPETSHSGALHGMPLACLLGAGPEQLTAGIQVLQPQHVAVIGVRSFEPEEHALLMGLGVRVFFMDEVIRRGLDDVIQEALTIVQSGTAGFGLSLDLDAIDPNDAPGVGTPAPSGLRAADLVSVLARLRDHPNLLALEIAEYDPYRDVEGKTACVVKDLLSAVLGGGDPAPVSMKPGGIVATL